jgi:hypothetical protein
MPTWTLASGLDAMRCHLVVEHADRSRDVLVAAQIAMHEDLGITHATIHIENAAKNPEFALNVALYIRHRHFFHPGAGNLQKLFRVSVHVGTFVFVHAKPFETS